MTTRRFLEAGQRQLVLERDFAVGRREIRAVAIAPAADVEQECARDEIDRMPPRKLARERDVIVVMRLQRRQRAREIAAIFGGLRGGGFEREVFGQHDEARARARSLRDAIADARGECGEIGGFADRVLGGCDLQFHGFISVSVAPRGGKCRKRQCSLLPLAGEGAEGG